MRQDSGEWCECGSSSRHQQVDDPPWSSIHEHREHMALSWLTARLTDDDAVEAAAKAIRDVRQLHWQTVHEGDCIRDARVALAAAADVIGGEADE